MMAIDRVSRLLAECGSDEAHLPPTALFNEGWMLRLILDWCSTHPGAVEPFTFLPESRWFSEPLLGSRFGGRGGRAEGFTHADAVIGHFHFRPGGRGDLALAPNARQLSVVEAKMGSLLSAGTSNAPTYNQAARNVACLLHILSEATDQAMALERLSFTLVAPQQRIDESAFTEHLTPDSLLEVVRSRAAMFDGVHDEWFETHFSSVLPKCEIRAVSWESTIATISQHDEPAGKDLGGFLASCLKYNPMSPYRKRNQVLNLT